MTGPSGGGGGHGAAAEHLDGYAAVGRMKGYVVKEVGLGACGLTRFRNERPELRLPAIPVHGPNGKLCAADWEKVLDASRIHLPMVWWSDTSTGEGGEPAEGFAPT